MGTPRIDSLDKNFLINGNFEYFQRALSTGAFNGANAYYAPDRWANLVTGQDFTVRRSTSLPAGSNSNYSLEYNTVSAIGGIDRTIRSRQRIEAVFAKELSNKEVSFKTSYKSESATQFQVIISSADVKDDFTTVTEIFNETVTILNDGSWGDYLKENLSLGNVSNGLQIEIYFKNTALLVGNVNHNLADAKLNIGTKAQEFSLAGRNQIEELSLCQRYFEKSYNDETPLGTITDVGAFYERTVSASMFKIIEFTSTKRTNPTITAYNPLTGAVGTWRNDTAANNPTFSLGSTNSKRGFNTDFAVTGANNGVRGHWAADAEL